MKPVFRHICAVGLGLRCAHRWVSLSLAVSISSSSRVSCLCCLRLRHWSSLPLNSVLLCRPCACPRLPDSQCCPRPVCTAHQCLLCSLPYSAMIMIMVDRDSIAVRFDRGSQDSLFRYLSLIKFRDVSCKSLLLTCLGSDDLICFVGILHHEPFQELRGLIIVWPRCKPASLPFVIL